MNIFNNKKGGYTAEDMDRKLNEDLRGRPGEILIHDTHEKAYYAILLKERAVKLAIESIRSMSNDFKIEYNSPDSCTEKERLSLIKELYELHSEKLISLAEKIEAYLASGVK